MQNKGKRTVASALFFAKEISGLSTGFGKNHILTRIGNLIARISKSITYTGTRTVGCASLAFGLFSLIMHLAKYYFEDNPTVELSTLVISAAVAIIGAPLLFIDKPLCIALQDFALTDFIFFEFLSIKRTGRGERVRTLPPIVGIVLGAALAVVAFFLPIGYVLLGVGSVIFVAITLGSPEFAFLSTVLVLPYAQLVPYSDVILASILGLTIFSFLRKAHLGKRVYVFGISDAVIYLRIVLVLGFGVIGGGIPASESWQYAVFALGYIPAANMIVNRRLADCAVNAVLVSAVPISVYAIVMYIISLAGGSFAPMAGFMTSSASLATYLLVAAALAFVYIGSRSGVSKVLVGGVLCLCLLGIFTTQAAPVLIVLPVALIAYAIIKWRGAPKELLIIPFAMPLAVFFLPMSYLYRISDVFGLNPTLPELRAGLVDSFSSFGENLFGVGTTDAAELLTNTPLGIACRFGIAVVAVVALVLILRMRQLSVYEGYLETSSHQNLSSMTALALFCMLAMGYFYDVHSNPKMLLLFFTVFGMSTASLRISRREYEDRLGYFGDTSSFESSDADIALRRR